jgi:hypothetical protein
VLSHSELESPKHWIIRCAIRFTISRRISAGTRIIAIPSVEIGISGFCGSNMIIMNNFYTMIAFGEQGQKIALEAPFANVIDSSASNKTAVDP